MIHVLPRIQLAFEWDWCAAIGVERHSVPMRLEVNKGVVPGNRRSAATIEPRQEFSIIEFDKIFAQISSGWNNEI